MIEYTIDISKQKEDDTFMNIAIVDDDPQARQDARVLFAESLTQLHTQLQTNLSCKEYNSAEEFLAEFQPGAFDLLLLDIYMGGQNGIDAARTVRAQGENCPIFFLTTSTEHMLDGYLVFASGYFLKPLRQNHELFLQTLRHCLPKLFEKKVFTTQTDNTTLDVPLDKIFYMDCNNARNAILHIEEKELPLEDSYTDCLSQLLDDARFLECYDHLVVNMDKIADMLEDVFVLTNQERIPISRRKRPQVKEQYIRYITKK